MLGAYLLRRRLASVALGLAAMLAAACQDQLPTGAGADGAVPLRVTAPVVGTPIATLVVTVTASDIAVPLVFNLTVANGTASGTIRVPPGLNRTIAATAMDDQGNVTHDGSVTCDVRPGQNPAVVLHLVPRSGQVPITITFGSYGIAVTPTTASVAVGAQVQLAVAVTDADGRPVANPAVTWATSQPTVATVSSGGLVTGLAAGTATIVATYEGVAALSTVTVGPGGPPSPPSRSIFPADNPWNRDISQDPVDPASDNLITSCGAGDDLHPDFGAATGIPFVTVSGTQARVPVSFTFADESDPGPYPIPPSAPIEGGPSGTGDRHVLVVDVDHWMLFELYAAYPVNGGASWTAGSGAVFDLSSDALRPAGWTSADAAGLPIFPGLARYDEVAAGAITHALRFTCPVTRAAYVPPARHWSGNQTAATLPPMGMRVRLKAGVDISAFPADVQVILTALKRYGMMLADVGSPFYVSGAPDARWNDADLALMKQLHGSDFEVVQMVGLVAGP